MTFSWLGSEMSFWARRLKRSLRLKSSRSSSRHTLRVRFQGSEPELAFSSLPPSFHLGDLILRGYQHGMIDIISPTREPSTPAGAGRQARGRGVLVGR